MYLRVSSGALTTSSSQCTVCTFSSVQMTGNHYDILIPGEREEKMSPEEFVIQPDFMEAVERDV